MVREKKLYSLMWFNSRRENDEVDCLHYDFEYGKPFCPEPVTTTVITTTAKPTTKSVTTKPVTTKTVPWTTQTPGTACGDPAPSDWYSRRCSLSHGYCAQDPNHTVPTFKARLNMQIFLYFDIFCYIKDTFRTIPSWSDRS